MNQDEIDSGEREGLSTEEKEELRKLSEREDPAPGERDPKKAWLRPAWPSSPGRRS